MAQMPLPMKIAPSAKLFIESSWRRRINSATAETMMAMSSDSSESGKS